MIVGFHICTTNIYTEEHGYRDKEKINDEIMYALNVMFSFAIFLLCLSFIA